MRADDNLTVIDVMERLGRGGLLVSVCCGPSGSDTFRWSVDVMTPAGESFDVPLTAESFEHAITIALLEIKQRGW